MALESGATARGDGVSNPYVILASSSPPAAAASRDLTWNGRPDANIHGRGSPFARRPALSTSRSPGRRGRARGRSLRRQTRAMPQGRAGPEGVAGGVHRYGPVDGWSCWRWAPGVSSGRGHLARMPPSRGMSGRGRGRCTWAGFAGLCCASAIRGSHAGWPQTFPSWVDGGAKVVLFVPARVPSGGDFRP